MHPQQLRPGQGQFEQAVLALYEPFLTEAIRLPFRGMQLEIWLHRQPSKALAGVSSPKLKDREKFFRR